MFSRTEQTPTFETYNLNSGIQDALLLTRNELKFLAIIEENMLSLPQIPGIGSQINQVIVNLLLNAAYAIKKAGRHDGKIVIRSYPCENKVCCEIEDNGCGIPPQIAHSLFEPFFTTKPTGVGTGLGLSISYDIIVNKHGGSLSFESVEGKGSIFMFCLPMQHD
jgi:signal transduction histidine kinase